MLAGSPNQGQEFVKKELNSCNLIDASAVVVWWFTFPVVMLFIAGCFGG